MVQAELDIEKGRLLEIFIRAFLKQVLQLTRRGIRSDYLRREEQKLFLKGRLKVDRPLPGRHFHAVSHGGIVRALSWKNTKA